MKNFISLRPKKSFLLFFGEIISIIIHKSIFHLKSSLRASNQVQCLPASFFLLDILLYGSENFIQPHVWKG